MRCPTSCDPTEFFRIRRRGQEVLHLRLHSPRQRVVFALRNVCAVSQSCPSPLESRSGVSGRKRRCRIGINGPNDVSETQRLRLGVSLNWGPSVPTVRKTVTASVPSQI